jgi:hypothetical protein
MRWAKFGGLSSLENISGRAGMSGGIPEISSLGKKVASYPPEDYQALASLMDKP